MTRYLLAVTPALTLGLAAYALRPRVHYVAPRRLAVIRAVVVVSGYAVFSVEVLSRFHAVTVPGATIVWLLAVAVAGGAVAWRYVAGRYRAGKTQTAAGSRQPATMGQVVDRAASLWRSMTIAERSLSIATGSLVLAELLLAVVSAPNTYDSQTYHLPRIAHWVAQGDVSFYPVRIHRQVTTAPGAEYLLLHLRLLTGGDALYGLSQWAAGVCCVLTVARITRQLGGSRRSELLAAFVMASTPLVVLESSSTQTDLVVAAGVVCLATLVLDGVGHRGAVRVGPATVVLLGISTGLIALTKQTGLLAAAPLLLWWALARLRAAIRDGRPVVGAGRVLASAVVVAGLTTAMAGPYVWRVDTEFGNPLGPDYLRHAVSMQRHDPPALLVNAAREAHTLFDLPFPVVDRWTARQIESLSRAVGVDPQDPRITFDNAAFPTVAWYPSEDKAALPVQALLLVIATVACLIRPRLGVPTAPDVPGAPAARRVYAWVVVSAVAFYIGTVKWQPWGNRLVLYAVVLAAPLAGLALDALFASVAAGATPTRARRWTARVAVAMLVVAGCAGGLSAGYGWPRALVGSRSVFVLDDLHSRFVERPQWADDYSRAATAVRNSGAQRIGLVQENDSWEYPWWVLLPDRQIVALQSQLPHHPPVASGVDAIVCVSAAAICRAYLPTGWQLHAYGTVTLALPADRQPP